MKKKLIDKIFSVGTFYLEFLKRNSPNEYSSAVFTSLDPIELLNHIENYFKNRIEPKNEL